MTKDLTTKREALPAQVVISRLKETAKGDLAREGWRGSRRQTEARIAEKIILYLQALESQTFTMTALIFDEIERDHLYAEHPSGYNSARDMIQDLTGRTFYDSDISEYRAWVNVVIPKLLDLGFSLETLDALGPGKIRIIIPIVRGLADPEHSIHDSTQKLVDYVTMGLPQEATNDEIIQHVTEIAILAGSWDDLRAAVGAIPSRIVFHSTDLGEEKTRVWSVLSPKELALFKRKMGRFLALVEGETQCLK